MKQATGWKITTVMIICLVTIVGFAQGQDADDSGEKLKGEVRFRYDWFGVNKDKGRFREDNWMTDSSTGGLDWLHLESTGPDKNGYEWLLQGRALYDYDYRMSLLMKKQDSHYLKLDFSGFRRYFDGSNEYWPASLNRMLELSDYDFFVDRRNYNIELGLTPPEGPQWIFGWHRLVKDGKEVLLHGSEGKDAGNNTYQSVPDILNMRGITDTFYTELAKTFAKKYNFRIRQEFERYRDDQWGPLDAAFDINGNLTSNERFDEDLGYTNWRTMLMFDSFLDDETYVTANYMYNYLNNDTTRTNWRPNLYLQEENVGNSRRTNVGGLAYRKANALQVPNLDFSAGIRVEDSKTSSESLWVYSANPYTTQSELDEVRVAEVLRLVYKGIKKTTLSFDVDLEQKDLGWDSQDTRSPSGFERKTDTDFLDQVYTLKAVHRHNPAVKSTVKFRIKDLERSYTNLYRANANPDDYPGWLGSYRRAGEDLTLKTDFRLNNKTSTTLMYQFVQESINFALGDKTSNQEIHRGAGSVSLSPTQNLFLVGTFMLENYDLDTPAVGTGSQALGPGPYDFRGSSYSLMLDGTYAFNEKTSLTLGFRHTEGLGTVDYAGDYAYDKIGLMLKHKIGENQTIGVGYQFLNFNSHDGGDFDDYRGHGAMITYSFTF
ncbi:MAG: TonB-dependent receptor [Planctomycetota bacterium]|jgi:hypothetical protein